MDCIHFLIITKKIKFIKYHISTSHGYILDIASGHGHGMDI